MDNNQNKPFPRTPVPQPAQQINKKREVFDFFEALKRTIKGAKITRLAWETNDTFGQRSASHFYSRGVQVMDSGSRRYRSDRLGRITSSNEGINYEKQSCYRRFRMGRKSHV